MKNTLFPFLLAVLLLSGCIGDDVVDDFVQPTLKIMNPLDTLGKGETWQFEAKFTNNIGLEEALPLTWSSSDETVLGISDSGLATGLAKGSATLKVEADYNGTPVSETLLVVVDEETVVSPTSRSGEIKSTSSYLLKGNFVLEPSGDGIKITIADGYMASTALPGLYVYLGNNPNSITSALEIGKVEVFNGAHSYTVAGVGVNDFTHLLYWCKPFNVKVGEGVIQ